MSVTEKPVRVDREYLNHWSLVLGDDPEGNDYTVLGTFTDEAEARAAYEAMKPAMGAFDCLHLIRKYAIVWIRADG